MSFIGEDEVDYESTPEEERTAQTARQEKRISEQQQAAEERKQEATKESATEPEQEAKVDSNDEAKPVAPKVKIEPMVLPAVRDNHVESETRVAELPNVADIYVDTMGNQVDHFAKSRFVRLAREMVKGEVKFTIDPRDMANTNDDDISSVALHHLKTDGATMNLKGHQFVYTQLGIWNWAMDQRKVCACIRYLWDLCQASGIAVVLPEKWKHDQRISRNQGNGLTFHWQPCLVKALRSTSCVSRWRTLTLARLKTMLSRGRHRIPSRNGRTD